MAKAEKTDEDILAWLYDGLQIGDAHLDGQVVIAGVDSYKLWAASKKYPNPRYELTITLPAQSVPDPNDVSWMDFQRSGGKGKLRRLFVVLEFEPDTLRVGLT